jgi:hypothetical protein
MTPDAVHGPTRRVVLFIALGFGFFCLYFSGVFSPFSNPNELSRFQMVVAVAEHGGFAIDRAVEELGDHEDKAAAGGRTYSNKAPGVAFAALPAYKLLRLFLPPPRFGTRDLIFYLMRLVTISIVCTFAVWRFGLRLARAPAAGAAALVLLAVAFGTPFLFYARSFFSHAWTAALLFLAWDTLKEAEAPMPGRRVALRITGAGFLAAWALISEYTIAPIVLFLMVRAMAGCGWKALLPFALGMAVPVGLLMAYQAICFGSPFLPSYAREAYPAYAELARRKFFGLELPSPEIAAGYLLHPARGVLLFSPFLLWSVFGFVIWWRSGQERADCLFALAATVGFFLLLSGYPNWHGGWALGSRYLLPALFFAALAIGRALGGPLSRGLFLAAAVYSVATHVLATSSWAHFPMELPWPAATGSLWFLERGWVAPNLASSAGAPPALALGIPFGVALALLVLVCRGVRPAKPAAPVAAMLGAAPLIALLLAPPEPPFAGRLWRASMLGAFSARDPDREELRRVLFEAKTPEEQSRAAWAWRVYGPRT